MYVSIFNQSVSQTNPFFEIGRFDPNSLFQIKFWLLKS